MKNLLIVSHCILNNAAKVEQDEAELAEEYKIREEMEEGRNNLAAHDNRNVDEKKILLYEQIIRVV